MLESRRLLVPARESNFLFSHDDAAHIAQENFFDRDEGTRDILKRRLARNKKFERSSGFVVQRIVCWLVLSLLHTLIRESELASWACY